MAVKDRMWEIGVFGGVLAIFSTFILKFVKVILDWAGQFTPEVHAKLAANAPVIDINVRESLTGVNAGLSGWLADALGLTVPTSTYMPYVMAFIGGALLFIVGALALEALGMLEGTQLRKLTLVIFAGNLLAGIIIGGFAMPTLGITFANALIAMLINAAILSLVATMIVSKGKVGFIPF